MSVMSSQEMVESEPHLTEFIEKCSVGILNQYEPDYKRQQARLNEFLAKQNHLVNIVDKELVKLNSLDSAQLNDMMSILKTCHTRLHNIKERMRRASMKAARLKARSLKIQQQKQKEALERELRREALLVREQEMVVKSPSFQNYCPETSKVLPPKPPSIHSL